MSLSSCTGMAGVVGVGDELPALDELSPEASSCEAVAGWLGALLDGLRRPAHRLATDELVRRGSVRPPYPLLTLPCERPSLWPDHERLTVPTCVERPEHSRGC